MFSGPHDGFEITAKGNASPETQIEYLRKIIQGQENTIADLELQLRIRNISDVVNKQELFDPIAKAINRVFDELEYQRRKPSTWQQPPAKDRKKFWRFF